ncbi:MAG: hypothetical protein V4661_07895 [Pseudomonadota bacterium]
MTQINGQGWATDSHRTDYDEDPDQTTEEFEYNQPGKPLKAAIGVALLVVLALMISRFGPVTQEDSNSPPMTTTDMNRAPAQTTGQAPMRTPPPSPNN